MGAFGFYTFEKQKVYNKIEQIKQLNDSDIKSIGLEDRGLINKIIDFYNSKKEEMTIFYFGFSDTPVLEIDADGTYGINLDPYYDKNPPESNLFVDFFRGLFNFFGRIGSEQLAQKITDLKSNGSVRSHYGAL